VTIRDPFHPVRSRGFPCRRPSYQPGRGQRQPVGLSGGEWPEQAEANPARELIGGGLLSDGSETVDARYL